MFNRRNTLSILRIGRLAPTPDLGARGGFETTSTLLYVLIAVHALVLILGGAFTYARVPLGFWIADLFGMDRNPYDKIGHFFQGFVPALVAREILIRGSYVRGKRMLAFLVTCVVLAVSAAYELVEWGAAVALGQGADEFLGTQGYQWDTQSDMFLALLGSTAALALRHESTTVRFRTLRKRCEIHSTVSRTRIRQLCGRPSFRFGGTERSHRHDTAEQ
ncbi:MAG: DUF2238 domain-containing protein [Desulfobacteraceae bacterium]|nr:MAG: DUF2238 domain-containing protein [Desulfobacteraceae bacterium]